MLYKAARQYMAYRRKRSIENTELVDGAKEVVFLFLARDIVPKIADIDVVFGILAPIRVRFSCRSFFALQSAVDKQFKLASIKLPAT